MAWVKDPLKHLTWNVLTKLWDLILTKIVHRRRLTGYWIRLRPLFFKNCLNLFTPLKQNPVTILYPQILQSWRIYPEAFWGNTNLGSFKGFIRWSVMKINFMILLKLHSSTQLWMFSWYVSSNYPANTG